MAYGTGAASSIMRVLIRSSSNTCLCLVIVCMCSSSSKQGASLRVRWGVYSSSHSTSTPQARRECVSPPSPDSEWGILQGTWDSKTHLSPKYLHFKENHCTVLRHNVTLNSVGGWMLPQTSTTYHPVLIRNVLPS